MPAGAGGAAVRCRPEPARPADTAYASSTAATAVPEDAERLSGPAHPCEYPNRQDIPALPALGEGELNDERRRGRENVAEVA